MEKQCQTCVQYSVVSLLSADSTLLRVYCGHMHGMKSNQTILPKNILQAHTVGEESAKVIYINLVLAFNLCYYMFCLAACAKV